MWFAMWSSTSASYLDDLTADAQSKKSSKKKAAEECVLKLLHGGVTIVTSTTPKTRCGS